MSSSEHPVSDGNGPTRCGGCGERVPEELLEDAIEWDIRDAERPQQRAYRYRFCSDICLGAARRRIMCGEEPGLHGEPEEVIL